jgi:chromosome segregation ATPase
MSNKKELKQQVRSDVTMLEELTRLKKDIETYKQVGEQMGVEILSLKRQNAGLKGLNKQLQKRVEHYRKLDLEGDELNEEKIAKIETLTNELKAINKELEQSKLAYSNVSAQAIGRRETIDKLNKKICGLEKEILELRSTIDSYNAMPWYKRIYKNM